MKASSSLVKNLLLRIFLVTATLVIAMAAFTYYSVFYQEKHTMLTDSRTWMAERMRVDNQLLALTEHDSAAIARQLMQSSASESDQHAFYYLFTDFLDELTTPWLNDLYTQVREHSESSSQEPHQVHTVPSRDELHYLLIGEFATPPGFLVYRITIAPSHDAAYRAARSLLFKGLVMLLVTLIVIYSMMRYYFQNPLQQIRAAIEAVSRGNYRTVVEGKVDLPLELDNEIGLLSNAVLDMAVNVNDTHTTYQQTIVERTKALQSANKALYAVYSSEKRP